MKKALSVLVICAVLVGLFALPAAAYEDVYVPLPTCIRSTHNMFYDLEGNLYSELFDTYNEQGLTVEEVDIDYEGGAVESIEKAVYSYDEAGRCTGWRYYVAGADEEFVLDSSACYSYAPGKETEFIYEYCGPFPKLAAKRVSFYDGDGNELLRKKYEADECGFLWLTFCKTEQDCGDRHITTQFYYEKGKLTDGYKAVFQEDADGRELLHAYYEYDPCLRDFLPDYRYTYEYEEGTGNFFTYCSYADESGEWGEPEITYSEYVLDEKGREIGLNVYLIDPVTGEKALTEKTEYVYDARGFMIGVNIYMKNPGDEEWGTSLFGNTDYDGYGINIHERQEFWFGDVVDGSETYTEYEVSHLNVILIEGQPATTEADGWKDCYYCTACGRYYEDADCTVPIFDLDEWRLSDGKLDRIQPEPEPEPAPEPKPDPVPVNPNTAADEAPAMSAIQTDAHQANDGGVALFIALTALAAASAGVLIFANRRMDVK